MSRVWENGSDMKSVENVSYGKSLEGFYHHLKHLPMSRLWVKVFKRQECGKTFSILGVW